jgi:hypothetical protein
MREYNTEMRTSKELYTNASVIIGGAVCTVLMANNIIGRMSDWNQPSVFPGFRIMCGLCFPILYFWVGTLLRAWIKDPKWWFQILLAGASIYCMYFYRHYAENWGYADALYLSMAGIGFLIPPKILLSSYQNRGWISLVMILLSAFCYTALTTVKDRLLWGPVIPEHPDMELMMETILVNAEPLMVIIAIYFVAQFAFSEVGQKLGSLAWFRWVVAVPCTYVFLGYLSRLFTMRMFFFANHWVYYSPIMWFIVQPVTIYLVVFLYRVIREHRKMKEERVSWKELAKL